MASPQRSPAATTPTPGSARVVSPHFARIASPVASPSPPPAAAAAAAAGEAPQVVHSHPALAALASYLRSLGGSLPPGWRVDVRTRASGATAGHTDIYFISPAGARMRSRLEVARALGLADDARRAPSPRPPAAKRPKAASRVLSPFFAASSPQPQQVAAQASPPRPRVPAAAGARCDTSAWEPPPSPYGLIQETLFRDPWKVLVACMLLNKTTSDAVRRVIWELFQLIPTPEAATAVAEADIARLLKPLGLVKRASYIQRMSAQYLGGEWRHVEQLCGCGRYAADAYALFCSGAWRQLADSPPADKELVKYYRFLVETDGKGRGLTRDPPPKGFTIAGL